ncbi:hypothetical protein, partial [Vibrio cholerae]|uniref:hypothetical protein n=1 Tax=Vibrio cholerae TaxID=666 RepID=UPI003080AE8C
MAKVSGESVRLFLDIKSVSFGDHFNCIVPIGLLIQTRGNRTYANTTIRGISSPDYYSPTVSIYVDGVLQDSA